MLRYSCWTIDLAPSPVPCSPEPVACDGGGRLGDGGRAVLVWLTAALVLLAGFVGTGRAQGVDEWAGRGQVVVPQFGGFPLDGARNLMVRGIDYRVDLSGPLAVVTLDVSIENLGERAQEAVLMLPVPRDVVVRDFDFEGASAEPTAQLVEATQARRSYEAIVNRVRDPALLEFQSQAAIRTSVFPVPPGGKQRVRVVYEQLLGPELDVDGQETFELLLLRSDAWRVESPQMSISVEVHGFGPIASLWSPTHGIDVQRQAPDRMRVVLAQAGLGEPGSFRLSIQPAREGPAAMLYAHPDPRGEGGTFLLRATPPLPKRETPPREVALVLDRSGSMRGKKLDQALAAARGVLGSLRPIDSFQLVTFSGEVTSFTNGPRAADPGAIQAATAWLSATQASGATNICDALAAVLSHPVRGDDFPLVLFLTDGQPTASITQEPELLAFVRGRNSFGRRIHSLGVGSDVNAPLLDKLSLDALGTSQYVLETEDVGVALTGLAKRLSQPRMTDIQIEVTDERGNPAPHLANQIVPGRFVDLFDGESLMILARYPKGAQRLGLKIDSKIDGQPARSAWIFSLASANPNNAFVSRLWAQKLMVELVDRVRAAGADGKQGEAVVLELVEEIRQLSQRWGVLSEYTSFLALEGTPLGNPEQVRSLIASRLVSRAQRQRTGQGAVVQARNQNAWRRGTRSDRLGRILTEGKSLLSASRVQQIGERTFYLRKDCWIDGTLIELGPVAGNALEVATLEYGTKEYRQANHWLAEHGLGGVLSLPGSALIEVDGSVVCLRRPAPAGAGAAPVPGANGEGSPDSMPKLQPVESGLGAGS